MLQSNHTTLLDKCQPWCRDNEILHYRRLTFLHYDLHAKVVFDLCPNFEKIRVTPSYCMHEGGSLGWSNFVAFFGINIKTDPTDFFPVPTDFMSDISVNRLRFENLTIRDVSASAFQTSFLLGAVVKLWGVQREHNPASKIRLASAASNLSHVFIESFPLENEKRAVTCCEVSKSGEMILIHLYICTQLAW